MCAKQRCLSSSSDFHDHHPASTNAFQMSRSVQPSQREKCWWLLKPTLSRQPTQPPSLPPSIWAQSHRYGVELTEVTTCWHSVSAVPEAEMTSCYALPAPLDPRYWLFQHTLLYCLTSELLCAHVCLWHYPAPTLSLSLEQVIFLSGFKRCLSRCLHSECRHWS